MPKRAPTYLPRPPGGDMSMLLTIGHSSDSMPELLESLRAHGGRTAVGCAESSAAPRHNPQFNTDVPAGPLRGEGVRCATLPGSAGAGIRGRTRRPGLAEPQFSRIRRLFIEMPEF